MAEAIRLVVWDLDETFWGGTLTEGGIVWRDECREIVVELSRRGIMNSICSKNDFETVKTLLIERGVWEYFIFPSIDWSPKGPRVLQIVEAVQLRPQSVILIDDNHLNLEEAKFFTPGIQVAPDTFIPLILCDPLFIGKDDRAMTRLKQYKVLERRKADEERVRQTAGGDNLSFLRASDIRVRIESDVEAHLDRAIELINRTNQLNFTKRRLPEDLDLARERLREELSDFVNQAGLIEVSDNYGDYGFCGYFQVATRRNVSQLQQFCFSCRILGLGVEAWLYQRLARPALKIVGEVLSDPAADAPVDWIRLTAESGVSGGREGSTGSPGLGSVAARGGCGLWPLAHYFRLIAPKVVGEFGAIRDGKLIPLDHSLCLWHAMTGVSGDDLAAIAPLGYTSEDFETQYFEHSGETPIWIFSNWVDAGMKIFRHNRTGFTIPCHLPRSEKEVEAYKSALPYLDAEFSPWEYGEMEFKRTLNAVFSRIPPHGIMFVLLSLEPKSRPNRRRIECNRWRAEVASSYFNVRVLEMSDFIENDTEILNLDTEANHYHRRVFHRLFQHMVAEAKAHRDAKGAAPRPPAMIAS
jgi:FkbH-like protein